MVDDQEIIERVLKGSVEDYRELMLRHQDQLYRLAYRITGREEDARDAVQEAFITAYSKLGQCRNRSRFGAWIRRIVVNASLKQLRKDETLEYDDESTDFSSQASPIEEDVLRRARAEEIRSAVTELPPAYRTVVVLRYEEDMELREIAELLEEQPGTIYTRLHRARRMLSERLEAINNEV